MVTSRRSVSVTDCVRPLCPGVCAEGRSPHRLSRLVHINNNMRPPVFRPTITFAPSLGRSHPEAIQTAAELREVLKESPVRIAFSQLPRRPLQPLSAHQLWLEDRKMSTADGSRTFSDKFSWRTLPQEKKQKYKDMAVEDVIRYKNDYDEYREIKRVTVTIQQMFDIITFSQTRGEE